MGIWGPFVYMYMNMGSKFVRIRTKLKEKSGCFLFIKLYIVI